MLVIIAQSTQRIGSPILGYVIPAAIFTISFVVAFILYKHFTRKLKDWNMNSRYVVINI